MFSSKYGFVSQTLCRRYISFLKRFCKKEPTDTNGDGGGDSVTITLKNAFKLYNLEKAPSSTVCLNNKMALKLYGEMQTIRKLEAAVGALYQEKLVRGFCHLYTGQEACCVGIKSIMRAQDTVITSYRSHGWCWIMGLSLHALIAEVCQKQTGVCRAKSGSIHIYFRNFYGGNGIVGSQVPIGAGIALNHAYRCDGGVNFACYGDGAANQGQVHEAFNMACLWKLPIVFVCENNIYAMGTHAKRSTCCTDYYTRGDYIPGLWVDANDVLAVQSAANFALNHALSCGPIIMELSTYRYSGHSMSDPGTSYRTREEVQAIKAKKDPIKIFRNLCLENKLMKEEDVQKVDKAIKADIAAAVKQMRTDLEPDLSQLSSDVYVKNLEGLLRNTLRRDLKHVNNGVRLVPESIAKATPKSDINEPPPKPPPPPPKVLAPSKAPPSPKAPPLPKATPPSSSSTSKKSVKKETPAKEKK